MRGFALTVGIVVLVGSLSGCASMCDSSYDCDFHAFGGMRDRIDRKNGRVGSIFDPAVAQASVVPPQRVLPPETGTLSGEDNDTDSTDSQDDDGNSEDSELRDRLLDALDKLDDLPSIPGSGDDAIDADDSGQGDDVI